MRRIVQDVALLLLCGGPERDDGIEAVAESFGARVVVYDVVRSPEQDLLDEGRWAAIIADTEADKYGGIGMCPPCSTFSGGRRNDGGPRPLRGEEPPDIYGLQDLTPEEKESVRIGTLLALRSKDAFMEAYRRNLPGWFETPKRRPGKPSVFKLPEIKLEFCIPGARCKAFVQCHLGARSTKPTEIWHVNMSLDELPETCNHADLWWAMPWSGASHYGPHPLLTGTQWMMPWEFWRW